MRLTSALGRIGLLHSPRRIIASIRQCDRAGRYSDASCSNRDAHSCLHPLWRLSDAAARASGIRHPKLSPRHHAPCRREKSRRCHDRTNHAARILCIHSRQDVSIAASALGTSSGSLIGARSTKLAPSRYDPNSFWAPASTTDVLPIPPGPTIVRKRLRAVSSTMAPHAVRPVRLPRILRYRDNRLGRRSRRRRHPRLQKFQQLNRCHSLCRVRRALLVRELRES
jgi:hypothetical protein